VYEIYVNEKPQSSIIGNMPLPNPYFRVGFSSTSMVSASLCKNWKSGNNSLIVHIASGTPYAGFLAQASIIPKPLTPNIVNLSICEGETLKFGKQNLTQAGTYTETFMPYIGCDSLVSLNLTVVGPCSPKIFAPNAFTPDKNGINDDFEVIIVGGTAICLYIYNRWGELIHTDSNPTNPKWDGKFKGEVCIPGTYAYRLIYKSFLDDEYQKDGAISLIR
jgi:gliding motility-associated-like protein